MWGCGHAVYAHLIGRCLSRLYFMQTPDMNTGGASLKLALKERNIDAIEKYFTALERDLDHHQQVLKEQQEQHHLELIALEREHIQLRMEWEREWKEREEALVSTLKSMFVSKGRLMVDIRSYSGPLVVRKTWLLAFLDHKILSMTMYHWTESAG